LATELTEALQQFLPADGREPMAVGRDSFSEETDIGRRLSAIGSRPDVALPPWEAATRWWVDRDIENVSRSKAA
jgi:hypothetical protein